METVPVRRSTLRQALRQTQEAPQDTAVEHKLPGPRSLSGTPGAWVQVFNSWTPREVYASRAFLRVRV